MTFNYEYFNKNSIISYPGKNSQSIFLHSLDEDNHGEENFYSLIVEERIFSSNKINEDSIDEDSEEKDFSIIFKESIFPALYFQRIKHYQEDQVIINEIMIIKKYIKKMKSI